jgi:hypothetical protein
VSTLSSHQRTQANAHSSVACSLIATFIATTPTVRAPSFWGKNAFASRFWFLAFYSVRFHPPNSLLSQHTPLTFHNRATSCVAT